MAMTAQDEFDEFASDLSAPATNAINVVPSDTDQLTFVSRALWVGTQGDLTVMMQSGGEVTFHNISGWVPVRVRQVYAAGTTATNITAVW